LQDDIRLPITGWLGHAEPFAFESCYRAAKGVARAVVGTPPILSLAAFEAGVDIALEAPMCAVRTKSLRLSQMFIEMMQLDDECVLLTPHEPSKRGSQIAFAHSQGYAIVQALIERGVIGDFRAPDVLRFGLSPLYLRYVDIWDAVQLLRGVMRTNAWQDPRFQQRRSVT
jgi:kynureninase